MMDKSATRQQGRGLVRAAGLIGLMTLLSRILGMVRDVCNAHAFGTSWYWDSFVYAFMIPNFFRRLVGEGALSNAFIPIYSELLKRHDRLLAFRFASLMLIVIAGAGLAFTGCVEGLLVVARHFLSGTSVRLGLTLALLQKVFPYLVLIAIYALLSGILHCHRHFFSPTLGPIFLNIAWIAWVFFAIQLHLAPQEALSGLCIVIVAVGVLQILIQFPFLQKVGFSFTWNFQKTAPFFNKLKEMFIPATMGFAVVQFNLLLDLILAFLLGSGAASSLWYGMRLVQFPLGIFGIAMGTALLPMLAQHVAAAKFQEASSTLALALRSVFFVILPCSVGLIVMARPIVQLIFEHGAFDRTSTLRTSFVLGAYSLGLVAYAGQKILASSFYAVQDARTPLRIGLVSISANFLLNLIFMQVFREAGLALATALSAFLQFGLLAWSVLQRRVVSMQIFSVLKSFMQCLLLALSMGGLCLLIYPLFGRAAVWLGDFWGLSFSVAGTIFVAVIFYFGTAWLFRFQEFEEFKDALLYRRA